MPSSLPLADPQLADTAAALAAWRSIRAPGARIRGDLWWQAIELAGRYRVAKVAVALKLDYTSLKRRLAATASSRAERAQYAAARRLRRTHARAGAHPIGLRSDLLGPTWARTAHRVDASSKQ